MRRALGPDSDLKSGIQAQVSSNQVEIRSKSGRGLRVDLPVQLGLRKKFKSCPKNAQNLCRHILGSFPPKLCENCAVQILHNLCTFLMSPHMFRTNFRGLLGTTPRTNFAQFSQTRGMFLESASVQANHVSSRGGGVRRGSGTEG